MAFYDDEMTLAEIHGTQLRMVTDELELGVETAILRESVALQDAAELLRELIFRNAELLY